MTRIAAILILLSIAAACHCQQWRQSWIAHPYIQDGSQTVFWQEINTQSKPHRMIADIACNGRMAVYVNGYNASVNVLEPSRHGCIVRYDITRFMRRGRNIIAIWACPPDNGSSTCGKSALSIDGRSAPAMISCYCQGTDAQGNDIILRSDSTWKSHTLPGTVTNGEEWVLGKQQSPWAWPLFDGSIDITSDCHCIEAANTCHTPYYIYTLRQPWHKVLRIKSILPYSSFDDMGSIVRYRFPRWFDGWVRVTLRGMHHGDTLHVNGLHYVCTGVGDEQACRRFSSSGQWMAMIEGDSTFCNKRITNVEGIEIDSCEQTRWSWY